MPRALPVPIRQTILACSQQGQDVATIADQMHLSRRTVQNLLRRFRLRPDALTPSYHTRTPPPHPLLPAVLRCRQDHPTWGAQLIRVHLQGQPPGTDLPSARTLQLWLHKAGFAPAPAGRQVASRPRAEAPHDVWQIDAVEQLPLADGRQVSWLRLTDECSGAFLQTRVSPPAVLDRGERRLGPRAVA